MSKLGKITTILLPRQGVSSRQNNKFGHFDKFVKSPYVRFMPFWRLTQHDCNFARLVLFLLPFACPFCPSVIYYYKTKKKQLIDRKQSWLWDNDIRNLFFILLTLPSNPNYDSNNITVEATWRRYQLPNEIFKEFRPGLPDIEAYRSSFCSFWNRILPDLVTYKGTSRCKAMTYKTMIVFFLLSV